ncbi:MAG: VanZ family protein [Cyanobacteria bacterium J06621_11]
MNTFVLCYLAATILLLTISPFSFQAYVPSEFWVIRASIEDVSRNVLLFMPFGMMLRHAFRWAYGRVLLGGFLLSLSIECTQLFIVVRTSNFADLFSNSSGALLGAVMYQQLYSRHRLKQTGAQKISFRSVSFRSIEFPIALMFIPMCWINAMRSIADPAAVWLAIPNAIAGIFLIQQTSPYKTKPPPITKIVLGGGWSVLALLPLVNTSPQVVWAFIGIAPVLIAVGAHLSESGKRHCVMAAVLFGLITVCLNLFVITTTSITTAGDILLANGPIENNVANKESLFQAAEIGFLAIATLFTSLWYRIRSIERST